MASQTSVPASSGGSQAIAGGTVLCALSASTTIAHVQTISTVMNTHEKEARARARPWRRGSPRGCPAPREGFARIHSLCVPLNRYFLRRNSHASVLSGCILRSHASRLSSVSNTTNAEVTDPVPLDRCASSNDASSFSRRRSWLRSCSFATMLLPLDLHTAACSSSRWNTISLRLRCLPMSLPTSVPSVTWCTLPNLEKNVPISAGVAVFGTSSTFTE